MLLQHEADIVKQLIRIADAVEKIAEGGDDPSINPVVEDESTGSCPSCQGIEVIQQGDYPACIYKCQGCGTVWVNDSEAFFGS